MPAYLTVLSERPVGAEWFALVSTAMAPRAHAIFGRFHAVLCALSPPVISSAAPVTMRASSDARYT
jgi:hypothetical protein